MLSGERPPSFLKLVLMHLLDFLMIVLLVVTGVSIYLREYVDAAVVLTIVVLNVFIGAAQEFRAEKTLEALQSIAEVKCLVTREGVKKDVPASDIIHLGSASYVPADARVVASFDLCSTETALTGNSTPVRKSENVAGEEERFFRNYVFAGCSVANGSGVAVVIKTGMATELGKIAASVSKKKGTRTDCQRELSLLSLVMIGLLFAVVVFAASSFHIDSVDTIKYTAAYVRSGRHSRNHSRRTTACFDSCNGYGGAPHDIGTLRRAPNISTGKLGPCHQYLQ